MKPLILTTILIALVGQGCARDEQFESVLNFPNNFQGRQIEIIKDKFKVDYDFSYPSDTTDRKIQTLDFMLTLDTKKFKKGKVVRGYTEFKGKCVQNCYDEMITAKGTFKVTVE